MTVQAAQEMWSRDDLKYSSPDGRRRRVTVTKGYSVVTDATDNIEDVLDATDLPQIGETYATSSQIRVVDVNPMKISPIYYVVVVSYQGEVGPGGVLSDDPTNTVATIKWRNLITEEEIDEAYEGDSGFKVVPIATANGEPVRGITERVIDWVAIIEKNYNFGAFDIPTLTDAGYLRSVNSDPIQTNLGTFAEGVARLTKFEPEEIYSSENGGYVKVNAEVTFRYPYNTSAYKAWYKRYLHQGYVMRIVGDNPDGSEDRLINALDDNKDTALKPILLNEAGVAIADPDNPATPPFFREQRTLVSLPYAALGLF